MENKLKAIQRGSSEDVRDIIMKNRDLLSIRRRAEAVEFSNDHRLDAIKFLGAYIGPVTPLQLALLTGNESIALDIIDRSTKEELELTFGVNNTALHLAAFLGYNDAVNALIERGVNQKKPNSKGFIPLDIMEAPSTVKTTLSNTHPVNS